MPATDRHLDPDQLRRRDARRLAVADRLRELRVASGLTQEQLGLASGLDRSTILRLENAQRSVQLDRIFDVCATLNIGVGAFFAPVDRRLAATE